jgi:hypothetical protein
MSITCFCSVGNNITQRQEHAPYIWNTPIIGTSFLNTGYWTALIYANNKFVALSSNNNTTKSNLLTSSDGKTWTLTAEALPVLSYTNIAYGSGLFVTFPTGSNSYYTSSDGITWTARTSNGFFSAYWTGLAFGAGTFVAVSQNNTKILRSTNGINWDYTEVTSRSWKKVVFVNNKFIATGVSLDKTNSTSTFGIITSSDGTNWNYPTTVIQPSLVAAWWASAAGNDSHNLILASSINNNPRIIRSIDSGTTWTAPLTTGIIETEVNQLYDIACGNGKFIAVNPDGKPIISSTDGINWSNTNAPTGPWFRIAYGNGTWVVVGITSSTSTTSLLMTSTVL